MVLYQTLRAIGDYQTTSIRKQQIENFEWVGLFGLPVPNMCADTERIQILYGNYIEYLRRYKVCLKILNLVLRYKLKARTDLYNFLPPCICAPYRSNLVHCVLCGRGPSEQAFSKWIVYLMPLTICIRTPVISLTVLRAVSSFVAFSTRRVASKLLQAVRAVASFRLRCFLGVGFRSRGFGVSRSRSHFFSDTFLNKI